MSPDNPDITSNRSAGKTDEHRVETTDGSHRALSAAEITATEENTGAYESTGVAKGTQSGMVVPAIPDFAIEGELGRGGMGVVYRAKQKTLNRLVAIKMILGGKYTDPMAQARFLIEAEVIAAIQHPNIVQLFQFGRHDDQPFFVLEFVGGASLAERLKAAGRFGPRDAAAMVAKLADGIATAHQIGVVHRDLKPGNVLLTEAGEPKITDFGLAKMGQAEMTATGSVMGTPSYMSPEQAEGKTKEVGTLTDVYALGAILYELTTGKPPFTGATMMATIQQVLTREPERPRAVLASIPSDLETICLKCLEKDAKKRYATALDLAADLRAFLDGRPIAARSVGPLERTWKRAKRNPAWTAGIVTGLLLLVVATVVGFAIREHAIEQEKASQATALVQAILIMDTTEAPRTIGLLSDSRKWADPLLRVEYAGAAAKSRQKLNISLALLPVDATQVEFLCEWMLDATPGEVAVIGDALFSHKDELLDKLWAVAEKPEKDKEKQRLRAASALAKYDPENEKWSKVQVEVVDDLVKEPAVYLANWMDLLRPVRVKLLAPLSVVYASVGRGEVERSLATEVLADYAIDQPKVLADLVMNGDVPQFTFFFPKLKVRGEEGLATLIAEIDRKLPADAKDDEKEKLAKRQTNAAVALLKMNQPAKVWPLLRHSMDPRVRSYLIHKFSPLRADAKEITSRLDVEKDITIRRALLLSLGEFDEKVLPRDDRSALLPKLQEMYRSDADAGLHAACEWLLRTWQQEAWLKQVNDDWAKGKVAPGAWRVTGENASRAPSSPTTHHSPPTTQPAPPATTRWYVNSQSQTMVVIPGPVVFTMGSPPAEAGRNDIERPHRVRILRTFALATAPVTKEQYLRFRPTYRHSEFKRYPEPTCPIGGVTWYDAAVYCNWLSRQEGIPEEQWSYESKGSEIKLKANYLSLSGYRLPTEAEMEYVTRAGAVTARHFGETEDLLPKYAVYFKNSPDRTRPVGSLKPNDFALFDVLGNVYTWCQESYVDYPKVAEGDDKEDDLVIVSTHTRVMRGGSFNDGASNLRSAGRFNNAAAFRGVNVGFRVARTLSPNGPSTLPPAADSGRK